MRHSRLFMFLTFLTVATTAAAVAAHILMKPEVTPRVAHEGLLKLQFEANADASPEALSLLNVGSADSLVTGMALDVPIPTELPFITALPWSREDATTAFRDSEIRACRMLDEGIEVHPTLPPVSGLTHPLGRMPALTIGLEVDPQARAALPELSKAAIMDYLHEHLLAVEVPSYVDTSGAAILGADARIACFDIKSPNFTVTAEHMVASAANDLRVLGLARSAEESPADWHPRTLVLIHRFSRSGEELVTGVAGKPTKEYELVFVHLLKSATGEAKLTTFATSEGRLKFHELIPLPALDLTGPPSVASRIRFEDFTTLGLYPASPTVTGVRLSSRFALPVDVVRSRLAGTALDPPKALSDLLDELHTLGESAATTLPTD